MTTTASTATAPPPLTTSQVSEKWKDVLYYDDDVYDYTEVIEDYDDGSVNWDAPVPYKKPTPWVDVENNVPEEWDKEVQELVKGGRRLKLGV